MLRRGQPKPLDFETMLRICMVEPTREEKLERIARKVAERRSKRQPDADEDAPSRSDVAGTADTPKRARFDGVDCVTDVDSATKVLNAGCTAAQYRLGVLPGSPSSL